MTKNLLITILILIVGILMYLLLSNQDLNHITNIYQRNSVTSSEPLLKDMHKEKRIEDMTPAERWGHAARNLSLDMEIPCTRIMQDLDECE